MKAVNLLPSDLKPTGRQAPAAATVGPDRDRPDGAYGVLAALALVVVGVALLVLAGNGVKEREAELAAAKADQVTLAAESARLASFGEYQTLATNRVDTVRSLARSRFDWERALRDLSRAVPGDVTLARIVGTIAPGISSGGVSSSNPLRTAIAKPAIELTGCTTDQRAVADLMARVRTVQGATRVSLSKSDRETKAPVAAASGGTATKPEGCGTGSPAAFEIVVFFETATASAATTAPGAAPAASPTPAAGATPAPGATPTATPPGAAPASTPSGATP